MKEKMPLHPPQNAKSVTAPIGGVCGTSEYGSGGCAFKNAPQNGDRSIWKIGTTLLGAFSRNNIRLTNLPQRSMAAMRR